MSSDLLEIAAGLFAVAEAAKQIAHFVVGDGEIALKVGAIGFLAGEALCNVERLLDIIPGLLAETQAERRSPILL